MKEIVKLGLLMSLVLVGACVSSSKISATPEEITALENMISTKRFEVKANWAQPMAMSSMNSIANAGLLPPGSTANRIDITGTSAYFRMVDDSVKADLPFYGERRMGGGYGQNDRGIVFDGVAQDLSVSSMKKGDGKTIRFNVKHKTEGYQVVVQLYPKGTARLTVSSTQRTTMWYQGKLSEYKEEY